MLPCQKLASALEILTNVSATQNDSRQKELRRAIGKGDIDIDRESSGWQEVRPLSLFQGLIS